MTTVPTLFLFVGESRSLTAQQNGWSWEDGRLAAKPLFEALRAMGIDPSRQRFVNLYTDPPLSTRARKRWKPTVDENIAGGLLVTDLTIIALGTRVSRELTERGIDHVAIVHPAARGLIRKRERYVRHVAERLAGLEKRAA